jgi:hypothetical protein
LMSPAISRKGEPGSLVRQNVGENPSIPVLIRQSLWFRHSLFLGSSMSSVP